MGSQLGIEKRLGGLLTNLRTNRQSFPSDCRKLRALVFAPLFKLAETDCFGDVQDADLVGVALNMKVQLGKSFES